MSATANRIPIRRCDSSRLDGLLGFYTQLWLNARPGSRIALYRDERRKQESMEHNEWVVRGPRDFPIEVVRGFVALVAAHALGSPSDLHGSIELDRERAQQAMEGDREELAASWPGSGSEELLAAVLAPTPVPPWTPLPSPPGPSASGAGREHQSRRRWTFRK